MRNSSFLHLLGKFTKPIFGGIGHILMFHRICDPNTIYELPGQPKIEVPTEQFINILDFFEKQHYAFLSLDDMVYGLQEGNIKRPFVVFTFDDGYIDNLEIAYPLLKSRGLPFAIYVTTAFPDRKAVLWRYILEDSVRNKKILDFSLSGIHYKMDLKDTPTLAQNIKLIRALIKTNSPTDFNRRLEQIFGMNEEQMLGMTAALTLSWDQLQRLSLDPLVCIAAHTVNHYPLTQLTTAQATSEVLESKMVLESKIKKTVNHFSYPYGAVGEREVDIVRSAGFKTAVTTHYANIFPEHAEHLFALPRWDMTGIKDMDDMALSISGLLPARLNKFRRVVTL